MTFPTQTEFKAKHLTAEPPKECKFQVGDKVTYTNDYGVSFKNKTILGFSTPDQYGQFVHLEGDDTPFWTAKHPNSLKHQ